MFKPILASLLIVLMAVAASAQPARQTKPAPKPAAPTTEDKSEQAASLFDAGQRAHEAGDLAKAVELYGKALELDAELWQAEFQRSAALFSMGKLAEAKASLARVNALLAEYPVSDQLKQIFVRVQISLGEIALAESKFDDAEKAFRRVLEINPTGQQAAGAHSGLAEVFWATNRHAEAIAEAKAAIAAGDDRATPFWVLGTTLFGENKWDEALPALNEALKREPKSELALLYRAEIFIAKSRLSDAVSDLRAALAVEPKTQTKLRLAAIEAQRKQFNEALTLFQEVLKTDPDNSDASAGLTAVLIELGKGAEAVVQLERLIKAEPNRAVLRAQLAELLLPKNVEKALEQYRAAAELDPKNANHHVGVASALVKLRKFQEAVDVLKPVLAANPKGDVEYFARTNLATALFELDDFPNAAREFIWILDTQAKRGDRKRTAITLYFVGICLDKLGDYEQALKAYNQFMELASSDNQLEVEKVKLRLPSLKRQIEMGKGKKKG
ncbi:MAG: tetratricopeptide repeat protein [Acidobacteriota bacterium]|nr:tetratricopeptide repeat protein [Acidobacteriota bacterium]